MRPTNAKQVQTREWHERMRQRDFMRQRSNRGVQPLELSIDEKAAIKAMNKAIEAVEKVGFFDRDQRDQLIESLYRGQEIVADQARPGSFDEPTEKRAGFDFGGSVRLFWRRNPS